MAVFMINICHYMDCGLTFPMLNDLILHIENEHLDAVRTHHSMLNPPYSIALSYIIRYTTGWTRELHPAQQMMPKQQPQQVPAPAKPRSLPSVCFDDDYFISQSEDSNDSWTTMEDYSEFIFRYGTRSSNVLRARAAAQAAVGGTEIIEKPFACPVPGCKKRYKNVNGIKYHSKNGHKKDGNVKKGYKCHCGKSYIMPQGLKNHADTKHLKYKRTGSSTPTATVVSGSKSGKPILPTAMTDLVHNSVPPEKFIRVYNPDSQQHYDAVPRYTIGNMTIVNTNAEGLQSPIISPPAFTPATNTAKVTVESIHHSMYV